MHSAKEKSQKNNRSLQNHIQNSHKVENLFAKLKNWRRIATRYDRCAHTFTSAIYLAATIIFWL